MATLSPKLLAKMREAKITLAHGYFAYSRPRYEVSLDGSAKVYLKNLVEVKKYVTAYFDCKENDLPPSYKALGFESVFGWFIDSNGASSRNLKYKGELLPIKSMYTRDSIRLAVIHSAKYLDDLITLDNVAAHLAVFDDLGYRWVEGWFGKDTKSYEIKFRGNSLVGHCDDLLQVANLCQQYERARW